MRLTPRVMLSVGLILSLFILVALILVSESLQGSDRFGRYYSVLLLSNSIGLLSLLVLIGFNLKRLIWQYKRKVEGAKITVRMVLIFACLAVAPVSVLYYFSLNFLKHGIDNWFDLRVEQALDNSLELGRLALDTRMRELLNLTEQIAEEVKAIPLDSISYEMGTIRSRIGAEELTVLTRSGTVITSSVVDTTSLIPYLPDETILLQLQQGSSYIGLDALGDAGISIRVVANIPKLEIEEQARIVQALFPVSERMNELVDYVQSAYLEYQKLSYLREQLKLSLIVVLTLVLLFSVFSALWAAFYFAQVLVQPIQDLARGTHAVAKGNYSNQLPVPSNDELGFLVMSFNEMMVKLEHSRNEAKQSQQTVEAQQNYLESILSRLSSGVVVFKEEQLLIDKINISASDILGVDLGTLLNRPLSALPVLVATRLNEFVRLIEDNIAKCGNDWREQLELIQTQGTQTLMISGTKLSVYDDRIRYIVVFDDITALIQGQRNATWSEMARRLAHEIKNPLTPIRLAAERLRHKYIDTAYEGNMIDLDRLTNTIINQVDTMKEMVNHFSDYARSPNQLAQSVLLKPLIEEVVELYSNLDRENQIILDLDHMSSVRGDSNALRRMFNNLLENAMNANLKSGNKVVKITGRESLSGDNNYVEIRLQDSGHGIDETMMDTLFEPYFTRTHSGTGLGLAIVKKIIDDLKGQVWLENNPTQLGACAVIRLPVAVDDKANKISDV